MQYMVYSCFSWCWASGWTKGSSAPQRGNVVLSKNHLWSPSTLWKMPGWKTSFAGTGILAWTGAALLYIINLHIPYEEKHHLNIENGWIGQHGQRKMRMNRRILRATKFFQCPSGCHKGSPEVTMDNVWGPTNLGFHEAIWQGFGSEYLPLHENGWIPPLRFWDSSIASKRWENNLATLFATGWKPTCHAKHHENGQSPFSTGWMFRSIVSHWCVFFSPLLPARYFPHCLACRFDGVKEQFFQQQFLRHKKEREFTRFFFACFYPGRFQKCTRRLRPGSCAKRRRWRAKYFVVELFQQGHDLLGNIISAPIFLLLA